MTTLPSIFPFSRLKVRDHEALQWIGYNPTFHRFTKYGFVISDVAFYVCWPSCIFARWRRFPLTDISNIELAGNPNRRPALSFHVGRRRMMFRTPYDSQMDEVDFDRGVLSKAVDQLRSRVRQGL